MDLKDITELVVSPVHSNDSLAFLESKIIEHRQRYQALFPDVKLLPKHHYLDHYPQMIRFFGPLVEHWTMRFEAKHSFFKQVIRHTSCFKNVPLSLALKHQMMIAYHLSSPSLGKSELEVSTVTTFPVDLLKEEIAQVIRHRFPDKVEVDLAQCVTIKGITYRKGMVLAHKAVGGLPGFCEINHICIVKHSIFYIVRELGGWYREHYRAFELNPVSARMFTLLSLSELLDTYLLVDYKIGSVRMVTLKRHIEIQDVDTGRVCVIKRVSIYMGEDSDHLIREYVGMDEAAINEAIEDTTVGTYLIKEEASAHAQEVGVVLEGIRVMTNLDNIAFAVVMLFGLIYVLNLAYSADLCYTFEVFQKIFMELDGGKLSNKALALKNRLFE
ncbi:uncharacterized protein LOC124875491 [Girardinichthys multiradiatus]|uniref:uncharacterized protein LOC124875491 n=1 Tax=Girardinichthys multiradiatus TaxID=208333 RepID=UPI001FAE0742|nr:uncharacterized protein LOC124875491 [Girardinichthys multiradiatus]